MNHLCRGGKNVSVVRETSWVNLHSSLPRFHRNDSTNGDFPTFSHISSPFPFLPSSTHGVVVVPLVCNVLLTWSASEVDSMLINSRSAVSLHICSHFIFRNLSRSSKITPERKTQCREQEKPWCHMPVKAHHVYVLTQQLKQGHALRSICGNYSPYPVLTQEVD